MSMLSRAELVEVAAIFSDAVELDPSARAAVIDARCGSRVHVRAEVDSLFAAHERVDSFMEPPAGEHTTAAHTAPPQGAVIGPWRLREKIGEGGMGDVYLAERVDGVFEGRAAIKFTRAHLPDMDAARRFRAERQVLASLHHANIVTLLDGGTTPGGQGYLVMEYVEGTPISTFCESRALPLDARLALMRQVCAAVQYAHQRAIVHRDLKPANILVTADGVPKILDFGVAKLLEGASADGNLTSAAMPGPLTPNYASPEQMQGLAVTTACDVYSLGVLLYEVIAGERPYETTGKTLDAVLKTVVETEPLRPSLAQSAKPLPYLRATLRGDLDAIVLKALRKEPEQRYGSGGELADDLGRALNRDPVVARAPSLGYVLRRLASRHRAVVTVAAMAIVAIVAALGAAVWQAQTARAERDRARVESAKAQQVSSFLAKLFKSSDPQESRGKKLSAQDLLDVGVKRLDQDLGGQPEVQAAMMQVLGSVYVQLGLHKQAQPLLERSLVVREQLFGPEHVEVADSLLALAYLKHSLYDYVEAERLLERAVRIREKAVGLEDPLLPPVLSALGVALWSHGQYLEARPHLIRAIAIDEKLSGRDLFKRLGVLATIEYGLGDFDGAQKLLERSLEIGARTDGERLEVTLANLGSVLRAQEDFGQAKAVFEEMLAILERNYGKDHVGVLYTVGEMGDLYFAMGDYQRARAFLDRSIDGSERVQGVDSPGLVAPLTYRGRMLLAEGKPREALVALERALRVRQRWLGETNADVADSLADVAYAKAVAEGPAVAEPLLRRAIALQRETRVAGHRALVPPLTALGEILLAKGSVAEARELLNEAVEIARKRMPERHSHRRRAEAALGGAR
jgi:serine/threonine protein kinase